MSARVTSARDAPEVPGVLSAARCRQTAEAIAAAQEPSGAIPWFPGGHTDPWDHVECAMALTAAGLDAAARRAYAWCRATQRADGTWPLRVRAGVVEDAGSDTNFCAYVAAGVWHHLLVTGDERSAVRMWPVVERAMGFVLRMQRPGGEMGWAQGAGGTDPTALVTGSASIHHSLRCAVALADRLGRPRPGWEAAAGRLGHALAHHGDRFVDSGRHAMDWYYPVLGAAVRGEAAHERLADRWDEFVVDGLGVRCVADRPWVTGAETCELALALDAVGRRDAATEQLAAMQHLRERDGSYWTGLVYPDATRWPVERTTWTAAAVVLAADALSDSTPAAGLFRGSARSAGPVDDGATHCADCTAEVPAR